MLTTKEQASDLARKFETPGRLCVRIHEDGDNRITEYDAQNLNDFEIREICEEIALVCRLARIAGFHDSREEINKVDVEGESKVCVEYLRSEQDFSWSRTLLTYMDTAIACSTVSELIRRRIMEE